MIKNAIIYTIGTSWIEIIIGIGVIVSLINYTQGRYRKGKPVNLYMVAVLVFNVFYTMHSMGISVFLHNKVELGQLFLVPGLDAGGLTLLLFTSATLKLVAFGVLSLLIILKRFDIFINPLSREK